MDTMRLALSAKQLAAIPDDPAPEVPILRHAIEQLQTAVVALQLDVAAMKESRDAKSLAGPRAAESDRVRRKE